MSKYLRFILCAIAFCAFGFEQSVAQGTFPGLLQPGQVLGNNGTAPAPAAAMYAWLAVAGSGGAVLYASPTGNDTNNSCLNSGTPCTLKGACTARTQIATFLSGNFQINVAAGTYSALDVNNAACTVLGNVGGSGPTLTSIFGAGYNGASCTSQTLTVIAVPNNASGFYVKDNGEVGVHCLQITAGNNSTGIQNAGQAAVVDYDNINWGTWGTGGSHVAASWGAFVNLNGGGETLSAGFTYHWNFSGNATLNAGGATNIPSAISWNSGAFLVASGNNYINVNGWSTAGAGVAGSTGPRAILQGPGFMLMPNASTPCDALFPGNSPCSFLGGFITSAGDPVNLIGTIFNRLDSPGAAGAGSLAHLTDGKASACGDGTCSTPGTIVTAGGGALDLMVRSDGANWRLVVGPGVPSFAAIAPSAVRAGDVLYWNGSIWTTLPGNNSGTRTLQENSSGAPSWAAAPARTQTLPSNPAGTGNTGGVMAGLAGSITPAISGNITLTISGTMQNSTANDGCKIVMLYGTGSAPANGAAVTGTVAGPPGGQTGHSANATDNVPFSMTAYVTGLTVSTAYWLDLQEGAVTGGTCSLQNIDIVAIEE